MALAAETIKTAPQRHPLPPGEGQGEGIDAVSVGAVREPPDKNTVHVKAGLESGLAPPETGYRADRILRHSRESGNPDKTKCRCHYAGATRSTSLTTGSAQGMIFRSLRPLCLRGETYARAQGNFGILNGQDSFEAVENRYRFHGREYDSHRGEYYYRYRNYIPEWGQFASPDLLLDATEPEGACNYVFCGNDPTILVDPLGLDYIDVNETTNIVYWVTQRRRRVLKNIDDVHVRLGRLEDGYVVLDERWNSESRLITLRELEKLTERRYYGDLDHHEKLKQINLTLRFRHVIEPESMWWWYFHGSPCQVGPNMEVVREEFQRHRLPYAEYISPLDIPWGPPAMAATEVGARGLEHMARREAIRGFESTRLSRGAYVRGYRPGYFKAATGVKRANAVIGGITVFYGGHDIGTFLHAWREGHKR